jgi:thioesterase domain-containing protein
MSYSIAEMQTMIRQEIPLCDAMDLTVEQLSQNMISLSAPMDANRNHHGSFFAGSLYSLAAITGWGLVTNYAHCNYPGSAVVIRKAEIEYFQPIINHRLTLSCKLPDVELMQSFVEHLNKNGRARLILSIDITSIGKLALRFSGVFTVLKEGFIDNVKEDK